MPWSAHPNRVRTLRLPGRLGRLRTLRELPSAPWLALVVAAIYALLYLTATGDIWPHGEWVAPHLTVVPEPFDRLWRTRAPFQFEAVARLELPLMTVLLAPLNLLLALAMGALVGLNTALVWLAVRRPRLCRARPAAGLLAALPGLLAGSACCGPLLFIALGLPLGAGVIALFGVMVPIAFGLLLAALYINLRRIDPEPLTPYSGTGIKL